MKKIYLNGEKGKGLFTIVDEKNYDWLSKYDWRLWEKRNKAYAITQMNFSGKIKNVLMHRLILGLTNSDNICDHIDGNGLNNLESNLRKCTKKENARNRIKSEGTKFKFKGIQQDEFGFSARIKVDGHKISIGRFKSIELTAMAYDILSIFYFGEFAKTNFEKEIYENLNFNSLEEIKEFFRMASNKNKIHKYNGVSYDKYSKKFRVMIQIKKRRFHVGLFDDEVFAAKVYDQVSRHFFPNSNKINFPDSFEDVINIFELEKKFSNNMNCKKQTSNESGVCYRSDRDIWVAYYSRKHIGYFKTEQEAIDARDKYIKENLELNTNEETKEIK